MSNRNVVNFADHTPHESGFASCDACGYRWVGVAPCRREDGGLRENGGLECPACREMEGEFER